MKNFTINVVFLVPRIDSRTGGTERQALQLASALKKRNCSLFIVTCAYWHWMKADGLSLKGAVEGFPVYRIPMIRGWRRLNGLVYCFGSICLLVLLRSKYSIIHAHELHSSGVIACLSKLFLTSKKVIIKVVAGGAWVGDLANLKRLPAAHFLLSLVKKKADILIGVSAEICKELENDGFEKIKLISNGVDTERFRPLRVEKVQKLKADLLGSYQNLPVVLFVGRLGREKNIPLLIESVKVLRTKILLLIIGEGELRSELEKLSLDGPSDQKIIFWGTANQIQRFYQIADVFVLPSISEGSPNTLFEAMSCGIPSIGSDIPGIGSVISDDVDGYLVRQHARDLSEKLDRLLTDQNIKDRFSKKSRETIFNRFSIQSVAEQYHDLYILQNRL